MPISETGIGDPHDFLKFKELLEETRKFIVNLFRIRRHYKEKQVNAQNICQASIDIRCGWLEVSIYHRLFAFFAFLLHVTSCCS